MKIHVFVHPSSPSGFTALTDEIGRSSVEFRSRRAGASEATEFDAARKAAALHFDVPVAGVRLEWDVNVGAYVADADAFIRRKARRRRVGIAVMAGLAAAAALVIWIEVAAG